jgi:hypothetical protein
MLRGLLALTEMKALRSFETSATLYSDLLGSDECGNISSWKSYLFGHFIGLLKASQKIKFPHAC